VVAAWGIWNESSGSETNRFWSKFDTEKEVLVEFWEVAAVVDAGF
jgi:hypothetical protein